MVRTTFATLVAAVMAAVSTPWSPLPASAANRPSMTPEQREVVVRALLDRGIPITTATAIAKDDDAAAAVPVRFTVEIGGHAPPTWRRSQQPSRESNTVQAAIGSCSGQSSVAWVTVYEYNNFGAKMANIKLQVNWCWNNSRVTYAANSRSYYVYGSALGTWYFTGWTDLNQYFYTSETHINGGVMTNTQAHFDICVLKYGCFDNADPYAELRVYWNGSWLGSGRA